MPLIDMLLVVLKKKHTAMFILVRIACLSCVALVICTADGQTRAQDDVRYLVIRRAGTPEKNYYELAKRVRLLEAVDVPIPDVITEEPGGYRYGVHAIWKVSVQRVTDSQKEPASSKDAYYVLIYERDPDTRFCAQSYKIAGLPSRARHIEYTDCEDKKQYSFEMTPQWPRPFAIYEVDVLDRDVLRGLQEQLRHDPRYHRRGEN